MRGTYFRAWDIEAKCYVQEPILVDNFGQVYVVCEEASKEEGTCLITGKPNVIIEQYTGLKDKNGKEICEGDIIRCHGDDRFIAPVIRHDNSGGFCWVSCYKEECFIPKSDEVEVIGNIHENPELIEKEKE